MVRLLRNFQSAGSSFKTDQDFGYGDPVFRFFVHCPIDRVLLPLACRWCAMDMAYSIFETAGGAFFLKMQRILKTAYLLCRLGYLANFIRFRIEGEAIRLCYPLIILSKKTSIPWSALLWIKEIHSTCLLSRYFCLDKYNIILIMLYLIYIR